MLPSSSVSSNSELIPTKIVGLGQAHCMRYSGLPGQILHLFGKAEKVWHSKEKRFYFYKNSDLCRTLLGKGVKLTDRQVKRLSDRLIEIANPFNDQRIRIENVRKVFEQFKIHNADQPCTYGKALAALELIKEKENPICQVFYKTMLSEIENELKPGDIIVRKYHEDNPNPICSLQKIFREKGYREAFKCSHLAMYLGKEEGESWVAEAAMPHGKDPQVRRLKLDDERFKLADKNQYLIIRNSDADCALNAAELAKKFAIKLDPENQEKKNEGVGAKLHAFKYNFIEAARSLWHSQKFCYFAKQRLFKYYSDYHNNVPFQFIFSKRNFFCSEFVLLCSQLAELKKNKTFTHIIEKNPPPKSRENKYRGFLKLIARICYVIKRAIWCRYMAIKYSKEMDSIIKTKLDFLRSTPQDAVNYMLREDPDHYRPLFMINKAS